MLTQLVDVARARSADFCQSEFSAPWALRIADRAPLALVTPLTGHAWVRLPGDDPVLLETGDVAIVQCPEPLIIGDSADTEPTLVVNPGGRLTTIDGIDLDEAIASDKYRTELAPILQTDRSAEKTILASGSYPVGGDVNQRLLSVLPRLAKVAKSDVHGPILELLAAEMQRDQPGQQAVLDRLLDLALIASLNAWFSTAGAQSAGWHRAHTDRGVGAAIEAMHARPQEAWTVASLAHQAQVSRAAFARRFTDVIGCAPITYLTQYRIDLASDLLRDPSITIETAAHRVGYANASALSVAFKRLRQRAPRS